MEAPEDLMEVYRTTIEPLYRFVSRRAGGSRELAEDITQEAYLRAFATWRGGNRPAVPLAWLQTVARNLLLNHFRRRHPASISPDTLDRLLARPTTESPADAALIHWGLAHIRTGWARLLEAYHLDGKDIAAIANEQGLSERAVEGRLRRAREALRKMLAPLVNSAGDRP